MKLQAVFLDRDGVINQLIYNPATKEYESPLLESDLKIFPQSFAALKRLQERDFLLFVVSNQPSYAKGKTSLAALHKIHQLLHEQMTANGIEFNGYFYCYHHPRGLVEDYSRECLCRKPKPYFLFEAEKKYGLDMQRSWFIGDQDCDVLCGQAAGTRTILIEEKGSGNKRGQAQPDYRVSGLGEAVEIILEQNE